MLGLMFVGKVTFWSTVSRKVVLNEEYASHLECSLQKAATHSHWGSVLMHVRNTARVELSLLPLGLTFFQLFFYWSQKLGIFESYQWKRVSASVNIQAFILLTFCCAWHAGVTRQPAGLGLSTLPNEWHLVDQLVLTSRVASTQILTSLTSKNQRFQHLHQVMAFLILVDVSNVFLNECCRDHRWKFAFYCICNIISMVFIFCQHIRHD